MKGWADRVFARGFAYAAGRKYDTGLLRGKTAMAATTGTSAETYAPDGIDGRPSCRTRPGSLAGQRRIKPVRC